MIDFTQDEDFDLIQLNSMPEMHASEETLNFVRLFAHSYQPSMAV